MARKGLSDESRVLGFFATSEISEARRVMEAAQAILGMRAPVTKKTAVKKRAVRTHDPIPADKPPF